MPYGSDYLFCNSAGTWKVPIVKVHAKNENEAWRVIVRTFYPEYTSVPLAEIKEELGHDIYLVTPQEQVTFYALPEDNEAVKFGPKPMGNLITGIGEYREGEKPYWCPQCHSRNIRQLGRRGRPWHCDDCGHEFPDLPER